jgi:DNA polymerase-3 subunit beta
MLTLGGDSGVAMLQWGSSRFRINALSPDEFPEVPANDDFDIVIPGEILPAMIRSTLFAASKDESASRYALNGARLVIGPDGARMIATDGHRLSYLRRADVTSDQTVDALIPRDSLQSISKLIGSSEGEVNISLDENRIYIRAGVRQLSCVRLTGQYPDCEPLLSQTFDHELKIDAPRFKEAVARMSIFGASNSSQMSGLIKFHFGPDICEMLSADHNGGEGQEYLTLLSAGPEQEITLSFNGRYLQDFVRTVSGSALVLKYNDENSSVEFSPPDTNNEKCILMPCR